MPTISHTFVPTERFRAIYQCFHTFELRHRVHICAEQSSLNTMNIHDFESVKVKKHKGFCKFPFNNIKIWYQKGEVELAEVGVGGLVHFFHAGRSGSVG